MNDFIEIRKAVDILRRRLWLIIVTTVAAAIAGYGISQLQTPIYEAATTMMVGGSIQQASGLDRADLQLSQLLVLTYVDLIERQPILESVVQSLKLSTSWDDLRKRVKASAVENTQILEITAQAPSRQEAIQIANQVARQLLLQSPTLENQDEIEAREFAIQRMKTIRSNIESGQQRLEYLEAQMGLAVERSPGQLQSLREEIDQIEAAIAGWDETYARLSTYRTIGQSPNQITLVEPAQAKLAPVSPRVELNTLMAAILGLLMATGSLLLFDFWNDTLRSAEDVERTLGLPVLGTVRQLRGKKDVEKLVSSQGVFGPASEDYRMLRSKLQVILETWPRKVLMVASPLSGSRKSITVANLGIVMAEAGLRVMIVDADLRRPMQHTLFQLSNHIGLTDLLRLPTLEYQEYLQSTKWPHLQVLTAGTQSLYPSEMLGSGRMKELLDKLADAADVVLCESAQAVSVADALVLARLVDGVLLTVEADQTTSKTAREALNNLHLAGSAWLGAMLDVNMSSRQARARKSAKTETRGFDIVIAPTPVTESHTATITLNGTTKRRYSIDGLAPPPVSSSLQSK